MDKFFKIKKESRFNQEYMTWLEDKRHNDKIYMDFAKEHEIESRRYFILDNVLVIVPTTNDNEKFKSFFTKDSDGDVKKFKRYSPVGRDWVNVLPGIRQLSMPEGLTNLVLRWVKPKNVFIYDKTVYGILSPLTDFTFEHDMIEITKEEYINAYKEVQKKSNTQKEA